MVGAEIVKTTNDIHAGLQGLGLSGQSSGSAGQDIEPLTEGGIEPFNESSVNAALTLAGLDQPGNLLGTPLNNTTADVELSRCTNFDHLHHCQFRPSPPATATELTVMRKAR